MKIPQYIIEKFYKRAKYGNMVEKLDVEIMEWCQNQGVDIESILDSPFNSMLLLTEPYTLSTKQIEILKNYEVSK